MHNFSKPDMQYKQIIFPAKDIKNYFPPFHTKDKSSGILKDVFIRLVSPRNQENPAPNVLAEEKREKGK
jgi:hypothetical protein